MVRLLFISVICFCSFCLRGQEIVQLEYYFDTDPGYANGYQLSFTPDSLITVDTTISLAGLSEGPHTLYIRARDTLDNWSFIQKRTFIKDSTATSTGAHVTAMECYFDADPGYGNGTSLDLVPGSNILVQDSLDLQSLTDGMHTLYIRCLDEFGKWSFIQKRTFIKDPYASGGPINITGIEFFIDEDPGHGNGTPLSIVDSTFVVSDTVIDLTGLIRGVHTLYARAKNAADYWSFTSKRIFLFDDERVEYVQFKFDSIPAYADWNVSNPFDPDFDIIADIDFEGICDMDTGWYYIDARARRELSWWSKEYRDSIEIKEQYLQTGLIADQFSDSIPFVDMHVDGVGDFASDTSGLYSFLVPKCWGDTISLERDSVYSAKKSYVFQNPVLDYSPHHILGDIDSTLYGYKCINQSGTIPLNLAYICENTALSVTKSGEVVDTGSISGYILHSGVSTLGTVYAMNLSGVFLNDGSLPQNEKLYVSPTVGRPGDPDIFDVDHECTDILLPGKPVVFLDIRDSIFIQLDSTGMFSVMPDTLLANDCSTCGINTYGLSQSLFQCPDFGFNTEFLTVTDGSGNSASCPFTVSVGDTIGPTISCRTDTLVHTDVGQCDYTGINGLMDPVSTWDNCPTTLTNSLSGTSTLDGIDFSLGVNPVQWTVDDGHGNTASCSFQVTVEDHEYPEIVCITDTIQPTDPGVCTYTITGDEFDPSAITDNCTDFTYWNDSTLTSSLGGLTLEHGSHPITWFVDDGHGQYDTCYTTITIEDHEVPEIDCPSDVTLEISSAVCDTTYSYSVVTSDNCGVASTILLSGIGSGNAFPVGISTEILQVLDVYGNTASCAFTVTVDKIPITVPDTICLGDSIFLEGAWRYNAGTYFDTLMNLLECDSIIATELETTTECYWPTDIVYVDSSATGDNTGFDWTNAYTDLQLALDVAGRYLNVAQVWVAEGTYYPTQGLSRLASFVLVDSVIIFGGFQGIESDTSERDYQLHPTRLSGDIGVITDVSDNCYHVVECPNTVSGVRLDGFIVQDGHANGSLISQKRGAALFTKGEMSMYNTTLKSCSGLDVGVYIFNSTASAKLTIFNCHILDAIPNSVINRNGAMMTVIGSNQFEE